MREIRFRAWIKNDRRMIEWFPQFFADTSPVTSYGDDFPENDDNVVLMQYTGLKDKNGLTDIYEGDIIDTNGLVKGNIYESQNSQIHESEHVHGSTTDIVVKGMGTISWRSTEQAMLERGCNYAE